MFWSWYFYKWKYRWKYSDESDEDEINTTPLTSIFKIIPSETDGNCLFHSLNNIVFDGQLTAEYVREEICDFIIKGSKYINICEKVI